MTQEQDDITLDGVPGHAVAGTPSPLPPESMADALETIEFEPVLHLVAKHAAGPLGAARVLARRPTDDIGWIEAELARLGETMALFRRGDGIRAESIPDLTRALRMLGIEGSVLEGAELAAVQRALVAARAVHADLRRVAELAPRAAELARPLPEARIDRRLTQSLDPDGNLLDGASPQLAVARREVAAARQRLIRRLESLLRSLDTNSTSPDATVTVRGGRYVIPVRRDSRSRPPGIVHDESGSAGTLFIEPSEAIDLGNAFREAQIAEERESLRVLRDLTDLLRPAVLVLRDIVEMCVAVDDLVARARFAVESGAEVPAMSSATGPLVIVNGRHPLLLAGTEPVIPFDLDLDDVARTLLVSGPNTGGKTVLLKAVALAAALAQSGIAPPLGAGSRLPVFRRFFADIGDRQSIAASLSTFSAHVRMLDRILDDADDGTLVLLDEIGSGTDPAEGAALAAATLVSLTRRRAVTLATTHLGALKNLATHESGIVNGSLQFDAATLTPTFRFQKGVPGRSYGLAIARRLGIAPTVLADAEARLPDAERSLDALLAAVEARERELAAAQAALRDRMTDAESLAARLTAEAESQAVRGAALSQREKTAERRAREQARTILLESRHRVEEALTAARAAAADADAREARRLVEEEIKASGENLARLDVSLEPRPSEPRPIAAGQRVRIPTGTVGEVTEVRGDGRLVVVAGAMRLVVDPASVTPVAGAASKPQNISPPPLAAPSSSLEVDLRGMTGDEAEAATVAAVDAAVLAEQPYLRIIHGMGTGVVRDRVRRVVNADRRVQSVGFAPRSLGGTGVTVVEFDG